MKNILQFTGMLFGAIVFIDFLGFTAWIISGQMPSDSFYLGSITANILKAILM